MPFADHYLLLTNEEYVQIWQAEEKDEGKDATYIVGREGGVLVPVIIGYLGSLVEFIIECLALLGYVHESSFMPMLMAIFAYWLAFFLFIADKAFEIFYRHRPTYCAFPARAKRKWRIFAHLRFDFGVQYSLFVFMIWVVGTGH